MTRSDVVKEMQATLEASDIEISLTTYWVHSKATLKNNGVAVSPQKPGGASLPSQIEKKIARIVRGLTREEVSRLRVGGHKMGRRRDHGDGVRQVLCQRPNDGRMVPRMAQEDGIHR